MNKFTQLGEFLTFLFDDEKVVGKLSDGQTSVYWLLLLATPYQGRTVGQIAFFSVISVAKLIAMRVSRSPVLECVR